MEYLFKMEASILIVSLFILAVCLCISAGKERHQYPFAVALIGLFAMAATLYDVLALAITFVWWL